MKISQNLKVGEEITVRNPVNNEERVIRWGRVRQLQGDSDQTDRVEGRTFEDLKTLAGGSAVSSVLQMTFSGFQVVLQTQGKLMLKSPNVIELGKFASGHSGVRQYEDLFNFHSQEAVAKGVFPRPDTSPQFVIGARDLFANMQQQMEQSKGQLTLPERAQTGGSSSSGQQGDTSTRDKGLRF